MTNINQHKIRITKDFKFEMAHALDYHVGKCKSIHGHSYCLFVTLIGEPKNDKIQSSDAGMVMDFSELKKIVENKIINKLDHALMLHKKSPYLKAIKSDNQKLAIVDYQPTCENMLIDFSIIIRKNLPKNIFLHSLKLQETPTSFAEWHQADNH